MLKIYTFILCVLFISPLLAQTDNENKDPFHGNYKLGGSDEIILLWANRQSDSSYVKIYDYTGIPFQEGQLNTGDKWFETDQTGADYRKGFDLFSSDLNSDGFEDVVSTWIGRDTSVILSIPQTGSGGKNWLESSNLKFKDAQTGPHPDIDHQLRLVPAYLDTDTDREMILAYWDAEEKIRIRAFEASANLTPIELGSVAQDLLGASVEKDNAIRFDISAGDFNGDGDDEVLLLWHVPDADGAGHWGLRARLYEFDSGSFISLYEDFIYVHTDGATSGYHLNRLALGTGDFDDDTIDEAAFSYQIADPGLPTYIYLQPFMFQDDTSTTDFEPLETFVLDEEKKIRIENTSGNDGWPAQILTADLDGNGRDELFSVARNRIRSYALDNDLNMRGIGSIAFSSDASEENHRVMAISDFNAEESLDDEDGKWIPELIVVENKDVPPAYAPSRIFTINVYEADMTFIDGELERVDYVLKAELDDELMDGPTQRSYAVAAGDLDANSVRLGRPKYYERNEIVQPLVILNAPPTHFDVFDDEVYDINYCYTTGECDFQALYEISSEKTISFSTQITQDWAVDVEVSGGFSFLGVGVEASVNASYGEQFSKSKASVRSIKVTKTIEATSDDLIYATVIDYDIWEYPVFADGEERGNIVVVVPNLQSNDWFSSKSPKASAYLPGHEVGNILSYQDIIEDPSQNSSFSKSIWFDLENDRFNLNDNSSYNWFISRTDAQQTVTENVVNRSIGGSLDFDIPVPFIPDVEVNGYYADQNITTHTSTVVDEQGLGVSFGNIDLSYGETYYDVQPYVYWSKGGALVLDYTVKPTVSDIGGVDTWWQERYGEYPDPALVLPWRYDPEKGLNVSDLKRMETKSLLFNPANPIPGEDVTISARVHNYSLTQLLQPLTVYFYNGDPDNGGELIGQVEMTGGIDARSSRVAEIQWTLPMGAGDGFYRIYAVLDPTDDITEIHYNNNVGWRNLILDQETTDIDPVALPVTREFRLEQNYPNPFNPSTTIEFSLPEAGKVVLEVFDMLGQKTGILLESYKSAGTHVVDFDASNLSSGVYFYRLRAEGYTDIRKMILLR